MENYWIWGFQIFWTPCINILVSCFFAQNQCVHLLKQLEPTSKHWWICTVKKTASGARNSELGWGTSSIDAQVKPAESDSFIQDKLYSTSARVSFRFYVPNHIHIRLGFMGLMAFPSVKGWVSLSVWWWLASITHACKDFLRPRKGQTRCGELEVQIPRWSLCYVRVLWDMSCCLQIETTQCRTESMITIMARMSIMTCIPCGSDLWQASTRQKSGVARPHPKSTLATEAARTSEVEKLNHEDIWQSLTEIFEAMVGVVWCGIVLPSSVALAVWLSKKRCVPKSWWNQCC